LGNLDSAALGFLPFGLPTQALGFLPLGLQSFPLGRKASGLLALASVLQAPPLRLLTFGLLAGLPLGFQTFSLGLLAFCLPTELFLAGLSLGLQSFPLGLEASGLLALAIVLLAPPLCLLALGLLAGLPLGFKSFPLGRKAFGLLAIGLVAGLALGLLPCALAFQALGLLAKLFLACQPLGLETLELCLQPPLLGSAPLGLLALGLPSTLGLFASLAFDLLTGPFRLLAQALGFPTLSLQLLPGGRKALCLLALALAPRLLAPAILEFGLPATLCLLALGLLTGPAFHLKALLLCGATRSLLACDLLAPPLRLLARGFLPTPSLRLLALLLCDAAFDLLALGRLACRLPALPLCLEALMLFGAAL